MDGRSRDLLDIVNTDVCGPMRHQSYGGKKYFVTFIDDNSRLGKVYFVKSKTEISDVLKNYRAEAETLTAEKSRHYSRTMERNIATGSSTHS